MTEVVSLKGGCDCGVVRYELTRRPLFVHCCHCRWCQRESGSAFALNAMIESDHVRLEGRDPEPVDTPSESGKGQLFMRCPECRITLWSHYGGAGDLVAFVRVGTLDEPDLLPPDIHIFTQSKQPWVQLTDNVPVKEAFYDREECWPKESLARRKALIENV